MKSNNSAQLSRGFTIIELLVVIVIIGILATIGVVSYGGIRSKAIITSLQSDLINSSDQLVIDQARNSAGTFPTSLAQADGGAGVTSSPNTTYQYTVNNTNTPKTFCLTATNSSQNYFITQEGTPLPGPCPVLYLDAGIKTSYSGTGNVWTDLSGNGNNGTTSGLTYSSDGGGLLSFDGATGTVSIPHNSVLKPSSQITISVWVKPTNITGNTYYEIYRKEDGSDRQLLSFQDNGTILSFGLGTATQGYQELDVSITASNYTNGWHFIAASYDGQKKYIYRDGAQIGTQVATGAIGTTGTANAYIGSAYGSGEFFSGKISGVNVYNKALSADEISKIFSALRSRYGL